MSEEALVVPVTEADLEAELRLRDLVEYIHLTTPRYMPPYHLAPLLRRFELAVDRIPQRIVCAAPPRHAKTESVLHVPAYALRRKPELTLSYSTYADRLSRSKSRKARFFAQKSGVVLQSTALSEWRTTEGGGLLAGGVGGPLTGHGVDIALVDDPIKNRAEAESSVKRGALLDWMRDVLMTRIEPGGSIFVFMTRWHPDDLMGALIDEGFEYINLPALGRVVDGVRIPDTDGDALWPERWPTSAIRARMDEVGEYTSASLFQGQPRARGAQVFNEVYTYETPPVVHRTGGGMDSAYSEKKTADFSAYVKMRRLGTKFYVVDAKRVREPAPMFKARLHLVHEPGMTWRWYVATSELGAAQLFGGVDGVPVRGEVAKADKFIRALSYAAAWNRGDVLVPKSAPWLDDFLSEHASFTGVNDKRDDLIDAAVAAFDVLQTNSGTGGAYAPPPVGYDSTKGM